MNLQSYTHAEWQATASIKSRLVEAKFCKAHTITAKMIVVVPAMLYAAANRYVSQQVICNASFSQLAVWTVHLDVDLIQEQQVEQRHSYTAEGHRPLQ